MFSRVGTMVCAALALSVVSASAQTVTVSGDNDIYAGGQPALLFASVGCAGGSNPCPGVAPQSVAVTGGNTLTFSVTGTVTLNDTGLNTPNNPDGVGAAPPSSSNLGYGLISGIADAPGAGYLVGVFVGSSGPSGSVPTALNYGTSFSDGLDSATTVSPLLDQVFLIGNGDSNFGTGSTQDFIAPAGATTLYLGISDACFYNGSPSCYDDNDGSFSVTVDGATSTTPLPAALPLFAAGLGSLGLLGWRRKRKAQALA